MSSKPPDQRRARPGDERHDPARAALPTGSQYVLCHGAQRAVVTEVGAGLRSWSVGGYELLDTYAAGAPTDSFRGKFLAPWPNRVRDGRYAFGGAEHQLALNEPERACALHGLVMWDGWRPVRRSMDAVTLGHVVHPRPGYPFTLHLEVSYELGPGGLAVTVRATNVGDGPAPFGAGLHPYLRVGPRAVDGWRLQFDAATRIAVDERMLPTGAPIAVPGTPQDFRRARPVGALELDSCFGGLARDADGLAHVRLAGEDAEVGVWLDEHVPYVHVYTADAVEDPARRRCALAIEPVTCAPDAFNSAQGLQVLSPGVPFTARFGMTAAITPRP